MCVCVDYETDFIHVLHPVDTVAVSEVCVQLAVEVTSIGGLIWVGCCGCVHYRKEEGVGGREEREGMINIQARVSSTRKA